MAHKANIHVDDLVKDGWVKIDDPVCIYKKQLPNRNPINNSEDSDICLILHSYFNSPSFAVLFPDGGMLNFVANTMQELHEFENKINFYDPPF